MNQSLETQAVATQVFRAAYLDAHNRTYITGPYERDCVNKMCDLSAYLRRRRRDPPNVVEPDSEPSRMRIFNADGHFAKEISNHVGPPSTFSGGTSTRCVIRRS